MTETVRFRALRTFEEPALRSGYVEGLSYTVRPGDDLLRRFMMDWLDKGWVEEIDPDAKIIGFGSVYDP